MMAFVEELNIAAPSENERSMTFSICRAFIIVLIIYSIIIATTIVMHMAAEIAPKSLSFCNIF